MNTFECKHRYSRQHTLCVDYNQLLLLVGQSIVDPLITCKAFIVIYNVICGTQELILNVGSIVNLCFQEILLRFSSSEFNSSFLSTTTEFTRLLSKGKRSFTNNFDGALETGVSTRIFIPFCVWIQMFQLKKLTVMYHDFFSHFVFFPTPRCIANDHFCVRGQVKSFILGAEILKYFIQVAFLCYSRSIWCCLQIAFNCYSRSMWCFSSLDS